ncbi:hypothetical protein ACFQ2B_15045 [Streptomyces stramineus]
MSEQDEYFVKAAPPYTEERPSSLWRRSGDDWAYLSLLDWEWHDVKDTTVKTPPAPDALYPVSAERAAALEGDRQAWVRYWAHYVDEEDWKDGEPPTTVVRRRRSPERLVDESFRPAAPGAPRTRSSRRVTSGRPTPVPEGAER